MSTTPNDWAGATLSDGRYLIKAKLGEGGMGIVYRARDTRLGIDVVIKVPRAAMIADPEFAGRFAREIRSLVKLTHPCIVKVTDVGQRDGLPFAVMQYLPGGSLEDRQLTAGGRPAAIDPKTVPGWLPGVASALDYIHSQGYIHRDVKPGNILFDAHGYAFLGDFGVIKAMAATEATRAKSATGAGLVLGTPEYLAPELIMGEAVDGRADQYALAVTLYEMLCGRRPFEGSSPTAVLVMQTTRTPVPPADLRPELPGPLCRAVLKGLAKDPAGRYPSCTAFAAAVNAALGAGPAAAAAVSTPGAASTDSVKIPCASCGKKVAMSISTFTSLKRTGKSVACPACHEPIHVASERTQVLDAPARDPDIRPSGTQKLATTGPSEAIGQGPARGTSRPTAKIEAADLGLDDDRRTPEGPARTQILGRAQTQILPQPPGEEPDQDRGQGRAMSSLLPWIGMGVSAVLLVAVSAYALLSRGSRDVTGRADLPTNGAMTGPELGARLTRSEPARAPVEPPAPDLPPPVGSPAVPAAPPPTVAGPVPSPPASSVSVEGDSLARSIPSRVPAPPPPPRPAPEKEDAPAADNLALANAATPAVPAGPGAPGSPRAGTSKKADDKDRGEPALEDILAAPEKYGNQEVSPRGLFRVGSQVAYPPGGTPTIPVMQGGLVVKQFAGQRFDVLPTDGGRIATLEIEPAIADRLIANQISSRGPSFNANSAGWQAKVAKLTLRVLRASAMNRGTPWVCRIIKAEFLVGLDVPRIGERKYGRAFATYTIAPEAEGRGIGDGDDWQKWLGSHFIASLGKVARYLKTQQSIARNAANTQVIVNAVNRSIANAAAADAAGEAARRAATGPSQVVNGRALFNQGVDLNIELSR